ncbi:MAG: helicase-related protein, partial [bacterium]
RYIDSNTKNKFSLVEKFNDVNDNLRIIFTTDTLSEGFNISGADLVINFDIPYNPVRIIQRIGRATRLDTPKEIEVLNFRPDDDIDVELKLVETMELRIKDIIRFIGVEYRIWFETEKEILQARRKMDKKIYLEILDKIRQNVRQGKSMEISLEYSKPILIFLQKAIKKYGLKKEELEDIKIPKGKYYTLLKGNEDMSIIYGSSESFKEKALSNKDIIETSKKLDFECNFKQELNEFLKFKESKSKETLRMEYFNDKVDKLVNNILDYISAEKLTEIYPEISDLEDNLEKVRDCCGSTTEKTLRKIKLEIKNDISKSKIKELTDELKNSFTKLDIQKKLKPKKESVFAIGFVED